MKKKKIVCIVIIFSFLVCYVGLACKVRKQNDGLYADAKDLIENENYVF